MRQRTDHDTGVLDRLNTDLDTQDWDTDEMAAKYVCDTWL